MAQYTIELPCIADTYTDNLNPDINYGNATILLARTGYAGEPNRKIDLRFNHSTLPSHKKINSVKLRIYVVDTISISDSEYLRISGIQTLDWDENVVTWNNDVRYGSVLKKLTDGSLTGGTYNLISLSTGIAYDSEGGLVIYRPSHDELKIHSRENTNPPMLRVTYEDVPPNEPTPLTPIGVYKDSSSEIRFEWQYNSDVGGEQKKFDLQWSVDQSDWTTISETTSNTYYDMPADTFPAGNIYWRVRCYNEYDEVGDYCAIQSFYAIGAPNTPAINTIPTNTARPTISWSAFSQQVYQLQVLSSDTIVYDSGVVPGINIRSHKITVWLADGDYAVRIRIKNEYDMWSDWGSATVAISTVKPTKPALTLQQSAYGVEISATGLVYRSEYDKDNFICIGTASGTYYDNTVASGKEYKYFVRAVSGNDTFEDSDVKFIQAEFSHALIAPISDLTNVFTFSHGLNGPPKRTYNRQPGGAMVQYAGRKSPVWEPTEHISAGLSLSFFLKTWAEVETFMTIYDLNSTVLYRDGKGRKIYGTLSNLSVNDDILGYIISFTLNQVDYNEEV